MELRAPALPKVDSPPSSAEYRDARLWRYPYQSDPALRVRLEWLEHLCLVVTGAIAGVILLAWIIPNLGSLLFQDWFWMKANTALLALLSVLSLVLSQSGRSATRQRISQIAGALIFALAAGVLVEYIFHVSLGIDILLAADADSTQPGRMSPQTAVAFVLLSLSLIFIRTRKRPGTYLVDFTVFCLCPLVMVIVSGYIFGVLHLFGISQNIRTAPHTLLCLLLLAFVAFARRAEYGFFSIFIGTGIGSKIARIAAPLVLTVPFVLEAIRFSMVRVRFMSSEYSTALVTALAGVMGFGLILALAWRIDSLEQEVRDLSLRDDLTRLYNRRGFLASAERELELARREHLPFFVLFIDLDNLKVVNDKLGHDAGSAFLCEVAGMLKGCFRGSDIVGRIGGDEFVVAGIGNALGISRTAQRLQTAVAERNAERDQPYPLSFSVGHVTSDELQTESLLEMLSRADSAMYVSKREKKRLRDV